MRRDELKVRTGGTDRTDEFVYVEDELVVRSDVSDVIVGLDDPRLRRSRETARRRTVCGYEVWTIAEGADVLELVGDIRRAVDGLAPGRLAGDRVGEPVVGPHLVFGACGRVPMGAFPPMATNGRLRPLEAGENTLPVAVVDTGIVPHPWFGDRVHALPGESADDELPDEGLVLLPDAAGHGTLVAGIVLGEAPLAEVVAVRALDVGLGRDDAMADAICKVAGTGVRLLNLSFGGDAESETEPPAVIQRALRELDEDVVVVAAAGNFGDTRKVWPAAFDRVIAVGAAEDRPRPAAAPFTSRGPWVDVYASGVSVVGPFCTFEETGELDGCRPAQRFDGWASASGSSLASAVVTGRIAALAIARGISAKEAAAELLETSPRITVDGDERPFVASTAEIVS